MKLVTWENLVRLLLLAALGATFFEGFMRTPEAASNMRPRDFYNGLVNDGENTAIMKERHHDVLEAMDKALRVRLAELIIFSRPKRPGIFTTSTTLPSKVVATILAPGAPDALGQTKLAHCATPLR